MIKLVLIVAICLWIGIKIGRHSKASWVDKVAGPRDNPRRW